MQHQRGLAKIIEQQRREDHHQPGERDRPPPEMAHVGVKRFGPGHGEHHRAQREESDHPVGQEEAHGPKRVERRQDARLARDLNRAEHGNDHEIEKHDGAEQPADGLRAALLDGEQPDEDDDRGGDDERRQARVHGLQALDRRKHRNRRSDHRVAEKERRGGDSEQDQAAGPFASAERALDEREQREAAAFAFVVRAQDDADIFDRDDQHQRPEHEAEHAENMQRIDAQGMVRDEDFLHRVERRGADVAEHHPDRAQRKTGRARPKVRFAGG